MDYTSFRHFWLKPLANGRLSRVGNAYAYVLFIPVQLGIFEPTVTHGPIFGLVSVLVRWLFFMPAMGNGILASKTPNLRLECASASMMHSLFGLSHGVGGSIWII